MYKLLVLSALVCVASAGLIGHGVAVAPVAVAHAPLATSYQNSNSLSVHAQPVAVAHAAPIAVAHAAPIAVAHAAPIGLGLGLGLGHGLLH